MKRNDIVEIRIDSLSFPNKGKGISDGVPVTVKNTLPGQTVLTRISKKKNGAAEGELKEVLERSPMETEKAVPTAIYAEDAIISVLPMKTRSS